MQPYPAKLNIDLSRQPDLTIHRAGWPWAMKALNALHHPDGVLFDSFLERTFCWMKGHELSKKRIPYTEPWIGMIHNPPEIPTWHDYSTSPQEFMKTNEFQDSLEHCQGIFVLSDYLRDWLSKRVNVPVESLVHPTDLEIGKFSFDKYQQSSNRCLIQIGWWLRRMTSIYRLPTTAIQKCLLNIQAETTQFLLERESTESEITTQQRASVKSISYLDDAAYDQLLLENIVFVDLYDSSANNTIIECIARNTPLLVNPLPAVQEYLGKDYPFYFQSLEEAARKAEDLSLIEQTTNYLSQLRKFKLEQDFFCSSMVNSSIYQSICIDRSAVQSKRNRPQLSARHLDKKHGQMKIVIELIRIPSGRVMIDWLEIQHSDLHISRLLSQAIIKEIRGLSPKEAIKVINNGFHLHFDQEEKYSLLKCSIISMIQMALKKI